MSAIDDLIKHHEEMHHDPNVSIIHGFGDSNARAEIAALRATVEAAQRNYQDAVEQLSEFGKALGVTHYADAFQKIAELRAKATERDAFATEFGGGNIVSAMVNCRAAREENLKLSAGDYLLNEIGAALGCAPDATILERIAEQARQLAEARTAALAALDYLESMEYAGHCYQLLLNWYSKYPAPAPQAEQEQAT